MRAREFITNEQVAAANAMARPVVTGAKELLKKAGSKGLDVFDKATNAASYASGAGVIGDQSAANFVGDQVKMRNAGTALQAIGQTASKVLPRVAPILDKTGAILKTGTGPLGTAATLALRSGDAGSAYGPYADTLSGHNAWLEKHGYDRSTSHIADRDYKDAKANFMKNASWGDLANRALNPFADSMPNDDEIMAYRKPNVK
jgi:hypothetical protein